MKSKREVLREFVKYENCRNVKCKDCPYSINESSCECKLNVGDKLAQIGAMAILRMFREKKKPLLEVGTKIKFSDGRIATLVKIDTEFVYYYQLDFGTYNNDMGYLIGRTWEVVE